MPCSNLDSRVAPDVIVKHNFIDKCRDAKDIGLLRIRYYGYLIVTLYHRSRLHLSLERDSPESRPLQSIGRIVAFPEVGGLHHRYERVA